MISQPPYRAGMNLEKDGTQAELVAKLRADPEALAACKAERDGLAKSHNEGRIFDRCYVSKTVHTALSTALQQVEGP